ncbi:SCO-spondin-like [Bradysia coprophila]|uniref:SCO-spondin-like n=1 Tax=Bradysia coprophila TaxID=38358 RepID=UPI00187DA770|nr:SCO-spondin-like [Bradysia coprophila]
MKFALIVGLIAVAIAFVSGQDCGLHEEYSTCIPFPECQRSCYSLNPPGCDVPECDPGAGSGCVCVDDHVRNHLGLCTPQGHC